MIIFLYGPDSYRRQKKVKELVDDYRRKDAAFDLEYFDFSSQNQNGENLSEFLRLREFVATQSLFRKNKFGVAENVFFKISAYSISRRKELKNFLKAQMSPQDLVLIISEDGKPLADFNFLIDEKAPSTELKFQEFENPKGAQLEHFIRKEAKERGVNFTPRAIGFLAESFNNDSWGLINELNKLSFIKSESVDVDKIKEISDYIEPPTDGGKIYYSIMDIVGNRSLSQKLRDLEILFCRQEEPAKIFNILASQVASLELAQKLADYDPLIKFGRIDYEEALLDLVISH
ncbi:MAG: hypothetical protein AAB516_02025 [Patescibacteria group bacterium]